MEVTALDKEQYLYYRVNNEQIEILRAYFNHCTNYDIDDENFLVVMSSVLEDHPGLKEDLDKIYPEIIACFDIYFNVCFLTVDEEREVTPREVKIVRKLIAAY